MFATRMRQRLKTCAKAVKILSANSPLMNGYKSRKFWKIMTSQVPSKDTNCCRMYPQFYSRTASILDCSSILTTIVSIHPPKYKRLREWTSSLAKKLERDEVRKKWSISLPMRMKLIDHCWRHLIPMAPKTVIMRRVKVRSHQTARQKRKAKVLQVS